MTYKQCEGTTKKGKQCQNGAMPLSPYCGSHTQTHPTTITNTMIATTTTNPPKARHNEQNAKTVPPAVRY